MGHIGGELVEIPALDVLHRGGDAVKFRITRRIGCDFRHASPGMRVARLETGAAGRCRPYSAPLRAHSACRSLSAWIEAQAKPKPLSALDSLPSSRQVAFAEKIARIKHRAVPGECFRDKGLMSKWIDGNR